MGVVLYHNPQCSKSRATLALLAERGITPQIIEYKKDPLGKEAILGLMDKLDTPPRSLLRHTDKGFADTGLDSDVQDAETIAAALAEHPALMQRPVVVSGGQARIGRPPEAVLTIL